MFGDMTVFVMQPYTHFSAKSFPKMLIKYCMNSIILGFAQCAKALTIFRGKIVL